MKSTPVFGVFVLAAGLTFAARLHAQTLTDVGSTPPSNSSLTYSQPDYVSGGGVGVLDAAAGIGEEITLSAGDPTLLLTNIYVRTSGSANGGGGLSSPTFNWTLNLYNLTGGNEIVQSIPGVSVTNADYIDFSLASSVNADLVGGNEYAFTISTQNPAPGGSSDYYLSGEYKSSESANYEPAGISSEAAVQGNGAGTSLTVFSGSGGGDLVYYLQTAPAPEPHPVWLVAAGLAALYLCRHVRLRTAR